LAKRRINAVWRDILRAVLVWSFPVRTPVYVPAFGCRPGSWSQ